ncbi:MAG: CAP domain-containing protein [Acidimicrobiales bacterium]
MNWDRGLNGRRVLPAHDALVTKAQAWAEKMARDNRLSHSNLAAGVPSCWRGLAENVGYGGSIVSVEEAYMSSAPHRANILNTAWEHAAVGVARNGSRVFTVQVFMDGC